MSCGKKNCYQTRHGVTESPWSQPHRFQLVADVDDADGFAGPAAGHGVPWVELGNCGESGTVH